MSNEVVERDRAETAHACAKPGNFESPLLPATYPKILQHLILRSLGLKGAVIFNPGYWGGGFLAGALSFLQVFYGSTKILRAIFMGT